jgi:hypothetical protein
MMSDLLRLKSSKVGYLTVPESFQLVTKHNFFLKSCSKILLYRNKHTKNKKNLQGHHVAFLSQVFLLLSPENKSCVRNCVAVEPCCVITHLQGGQLGCCAVLIFHCVSVHHRKDNRVEQVEKP